VKQYLTHHLDEPITVEKMASIVSINCKYFSTLCRTYLDASFVEYLTKLRMERAYELLKDERANYLVKDVAEATGFTDTNYFSRIFRQHWGISPSSVKEAQSPGERGRAFEGKPRR
jgi:two-component system response regulator YesN